MSPLSIAAESDVHFVAQSIFTPQSITRGSPLSSPVPRLGWPSGFWCGLACQHAPSKRSTIASYHSFAVTEVASGPRRRNTMFALVMSEVTRILTAIEQGDPHAAAQLLPLVYDELRRLAAQKLSHEAPGQTLDATGLVHEAYLRL